MGIIDVANPAAPVEVGALDVMSTSIIFDIKVDAGLAYVAAGGSARIIDVSNPRIPVELGAYSVGSALEVEIADGVVYIGGAGMQIVDFGLEFVPEPSGSLLQFTALAVVGVLAHMRARRER